MNAPRYSILITYHNERKLLTQCLESFLAQAPGTTEILVYDDASAPSSLAAAFLPAGSNARIIRGERNVGPAAGRNVLLKEASCEYVHFHDADDLFAPGWSRAVVHALQDSNVDAVFTEIEAFDTDGRSRAPVMGIARRLARESLTSVCIRGAMLVPAGTYRREALLRIGGYRESLWQSEDYDFHVRLAASGISYIVIDQPLVRIRDRPDSRSKKQAEVWRSAIQAIALLAAELDPVYRGDLADAAAAAAIRLIDLGDNTTASDAFALADRIGPPPLRDDSRIRRWLRRRIGLERAARWAVDYRRLIPSRIRRVVRGVGV